MNFEDLCNKPKETPLNPRMTVVEFLKHNPKIFYSILKTRDSIYEEILDILLEKEERNIKDFIIWYRDFLYDY